MRMIAESAGATVGDCLRLVMYKTPFYILVTLAKCC
jgi:hypothetical protein